MALHAERTSLADHADQGSIYELIRARLAAGDFTPGQRLKPDALRADYGCSASTLREVLFRLSCSGNVDFEEQRGFRVPMASMERLMEVRHLRIMLESEAASLSISRGDMEWEARLNAAHHKLAHIEVKMRHPQQLNQHIAIWTKFDWEFHETLISACGSKLLIETLHGLFFQYRQQLTGLVANYGFRRGTVDEHKAILDAALERDPERCAKAIQNHFAFFDETRGPEGFSD